MQNSSDNGSHLPVTRSEGMVYGTATSKSHKRDASRPGDRAPALRVVTPSGTENRGDTFISTTPLSVDHVSNTSDTIEGIGKNFVDHIRRTEEENYMLKEKLEAADTQHKKLTGDNVRLIERLESIEEEHRRVETEIQSLQLELDQLTRHNLKLRDENDALIKRIAEANRSDSGHRKMLGEKDSEIDTMREAMVRMKGELSTQGEERKRLVKQLKDKERKLKEKESAHSEDLQRLRKDAKSALSQCDDVRLQAERMENENAEVQTKLLASTSEISQLKADLAKEEKKRRKAEKELSKLENDYESLKDEMLEQKKALMSRKSTDAYENRDLENQSNSLKITNQSLTKLIEEKDSHIEDLRDEVQSLQSAIAGYQTELEHSRLSRGDEDIQREKYRELSDSHRKLLDENKRLRNSLALRNMEEANKAVEEKDAQSELDKIQRKLDKANKRVLQLEAYMDEIFGEDPETLNAVLSTRESRNDLHGVILPEIQPSSRNSQGGPRYLSSRLSLNSSVAGTPKTQTARGVPSKKKNSSRHQPFSYR